jgi:hypothetical protein
MPAPSWSGVAAGDAIARAEGGVPAIDAASSAATIVTGIALVPAAGRWAIISSPSELTWRAPRALSARRRGG